MPSRGKKMALIKEKFEAVFGKDQASRTPEQWRNLVFTYGMDAVVRIEQLTKEEIIKRCSNTVTS